MNREQALSIVKEKLTDQRYEHTLGVMQTSIDLAKKYGADPAKAELAAIFHDYAKYWPLDEMREIITKQQMPGELLQFHSELWHAPVGAYLTKKLHGISDEEVLSAIRYHTTGRAKMTLLEKIVFLADYIEPGRSFPGVERVREIAESNLEEAILAALRNTITYLVKKGASIYPDTFYAYNDFLQINKLEE